ncbi:hypothetical protein [Marinimicrobium sp. ABcell2]|uniref:hypothetical protein n=1 Tax=Marinimicrobium sp. ABcell2 TaxID=3069751 RepID=UPI0027B82B45|nr:hypothetical protein [Marinimicrobium sp. ABcell2]MDQ2076152.1 hypothetical protein [Marinimicrobium sp. ABcell2]
MKKLVLTGIFCFGTGLAGLTLACEAPSEKPDIPDPNTAETPQMVKANNDVREYVAAQTEFINCSRMSSAQQRREVRELEEFAAEFNEAIRIFRARNN